MKHRIYPKDPHPRSWAGAILLRRSYGLSTTGATEHWLRFRKRFLRKSKRVCAYCGKRRLKHTVREHTKEAYRELATIDHVIPLSKGGPRYKEENLVVACWPCNQKKGSSVSSAVRAPS